MGYLDYATTADGAQVAYRTVSEGERTVVYVPGMLYPIDSMEEDPLYARLLRGLRGLGRLVLLERRGIGASDPIDFEHDVYETWAEDVVALLDTLGAPTATVIGYASSATMALELAARHPDRVDAIVALHPIVALTDEHRELFSFAAQGMTAVIEENQDGPGDLVTLANPERSSEPMFQAWSERAGRLGASPGTARRFWTSVLADRDLADRLPSISTPVLVLHRERQALLPQSISEMLAEALPNGHFTLIDGADIVASSGDVEALIAEIAEFITGEQHLDPSDRPVLSLLFTDLVDSTSRVSALGDAGWARLLDHHDLVVRRALGRHGGTLVKTTGDGALATFDSPSRALAGAVELRAALGRVGLVVRMGVHVGEVDRRKDDVAGVAVHLAARIMGEAGDGEILTSAAVPLVAAGSPFTFEDLAPRPLKGLDGTWELRRLITPER